MFASQYVYKSRLKRFFMACFDLLSAILIAPFRVVSKSSSEPLFKKGAVLIPRLDHIGDVILTLPVYQALKHQYPETLFVMLADKSLEPLLNRLLISPLHAMNTTWFSRNRNVFKQVRSFFLTIKWIRSQKFVAAIDFRGDFLTILMMFFSGIPYRLGRPEAGGRFLLTQAIKRPLNGHEIMHNYQLIESVESKGFSSKELAAPWLSAKEFTSDFVRRTDGVLNFVIHPHAGYASKEWPSERWDFIISKLAALDRIRIYLIGTSGDREKMPLLDVQDFVTDLRGELALCDLPAFFQSVDLFLGLDSGPAHLAAGLGVECISLFSGANISERWKPYTNQLTLIQKEIECSPCGSSVCPLEHQNCMNFIDAEGVFNQVQSAVLRKQKELS